MKQGAKQAEAATLVSQSVYRDAWYVADVMQASTARPQTLAEYCKGRPSEFTGVMPWHADDKCKALIARLGFCSGQVPPPDWKTDRAWVRQVVDDSDILPGRGVRCWVPSSHAFGPSPGRRGEGEVKGTTSDVRVLVGSRQLMADEGLQLPA